MPQVVWTREALDDVDEIFLFLIEYDQAIARKAINRIRSHLNILAQHPEAGRPIEGLEPSFREWLIPFGTSGYVAFYNYNGKLVAILAIRHQRQSGY